MAAAAGCMLFIDVLFFTQYYSASDIGMLAGALGGLIALLFKGCRQSRCTNIECFHCIKCQRDVLNEKEEFADESPVSPPKVNLNFKK